MKTRQMLWGDKQKHNIHKKGGHVMKSLNDEVSFQVVHSWKYHCSEVELRETQLNDQA